MENDNAIYKDCLIFEHMRTYYKKRQFHDIIFTKNKFYDKYIQKGFFTNDFIPFIKIHRDYYKYMDDFIACYLNYIAYIYREDIVYNKFKEISDALDHNIAKIISKLKLKAISIICTNRIVL